MADAEYRCFVGGLAWFTGEHTIGNAFPQCGEVPDSKTWETGRSRGSGSVRFKDKMPMEDAIKKMNGLNLGGRNITLNEAQSRGSGGGYGGGHCEGCGIGSGGGGGRDGGGGGDGGGGDSGSGGGGREGSYGGGGGGDRGYGGGSRHSKGAVIMKVEDGGTRISRYSASGVVWNLACFFSWGRVEFGLFLLLVVCFFWMV